MNRIVQTLCLVIAGILTACSDPIPDNNLKLWYTRPASDWNEALPVGNGRLGAMIFGEPEREHLQLNEETVWAGGPYNNVNPAAAEYIKKVRELIFRGEYGKAQDLANTHIFTEQNGMPYQPMGDLYLNFPDHDRYTNYYRELDISKATSKVTYEVNGITFCREIISSFADQVILIRLSAGKPGSINCEIALGSAQEHRVQAGSDQLVMYGRTTDHEGIKSKIRFVSILKPVLRGGDLTVQDSSLKISQADEVMLYLSAATNFVNYREVDADPQQKAENYLAQALLKKPDIAWQEHIMYYKSYFDRVKIDLGTTDSVLNPTDVRLAQFDAGNDPQLAALYFQYGRYLLISSSQPGGQPANLQGIWNPMLHPPWESKYTLNINCEMNYWPAELTNLSELSEPLFSMIRELSETGKESARVLYGARGWVAHHNTDIWRSTGIYDKAVYGLWQSGSNWLTQHLWQHFLFTGDTAFLRDFFPVMKQAAEFYADVLVEEPSTGYRVLCPSNSPEHKYLGIASAGAGATMDNQLLFDLFSNVIRSSEILSLDRDFEDTLQLLRDKLAPMQIGRHNQLQEWLYDWDDPSDKHRHLSHLYGLYPGNQISPYRNPELFSAAKQSLIYRGDRSTGWSMAWKINLWARLLDGGHAYKLLSDQLSPAFVPGEKERGGTYNNLLDAHPPFQIDGNFGCTAGIAEMLLQSQDGFIFILPALPDEWPKGEVKGLRARGDFIVDIRWEEGKIREFSIHAGMDGNCRIRVREQIRSKDGVDLRLATGPNPNPFYKIEPVKEPVISPDASVEKTELPITYCYDFRAEKGVRYTFLKY